VSGTRHNGKTVEQSLRVLLDHNPTASVAAVGADGLFVDFPPSLAVPSHVTRLAGRWSLDIVAPDQRDALIRTWERAAEHGVAHTSTQFADGRSGTIHFFDTRSVHGVTAFVAIPVSSPYGDEPVESLPPAPITPRFGVVLRDANGFIASVDDAACGLLRATPEQLIGVAPLDQIHHDDHKRAVDNWIETVSAGGQPRRYRGRHLCGDGTWLWVEFTNHIRPTEDGRFEIVSEMVDISEEMAMHEALRTREEFLRRLTSALPVAVGQIDAHGNLVYANERLANMLGDGGAAAVVASGTPIDALASDGHRDLLRDAVRTVLDAGTDVDLELRTTPHDTATGRVHRVSLGALRDGNTISGALVCMTDVTESADLREALRQRATYDDLTGLHNRASIMSLLAGALPASSSPTVGTAVVFVDLDSFKSVNDRLGHAVGDDVLVRVGRRLRTAIRRQDRVGRIGGDEFLIICPEVADPSVALEVAERVGRHLADDLDVAGARVHTRASIGVAWSADPTCTPEALIRAADAAMYEAKRAATGRPVLATR
jgi:diguanylate cyclase (GGDEF)-like protein/PAS domain S-box-containing protein